MQIAVVSAQLLCDSGQTLEAVVLGMLNALELHMSFKVNMKWHSQPIYFRIVPYVQIKCVIQ